MQEKKTAKEFLAEGKPETISTVTVIFMSYLKFQFEKKN